MKNLKIIDFLIFITFIIAATLVSLNNDLSKYGYPIFLITNSLMIYTFLKEKRYWFLFQAIVSVIINFIGLYNFWIHTFK